jgi:hypothetical protein
MREIRAGVAGKRCGLFSDCHFIAVTGRFTMGVAELKVKKEEGAGVIMWTNLNEDAAAFRRILPVRFAEKSRPPPRLIFSQNRPGQLASFPHPVPTRLGR